MTQAVETQALVTSVEAVVERVFDAVERLRGHVLDRWSSVITLQEPLRGKDIAGLRDGVLELLAEQRDLVVGMGLIVTPGLLPDEQRRLEWWQYVPGHREPAALRVDLNPDSMGFYEYESADWFAIPRSSGRRRTLTQGSRRNDALPPSRDRPRRSRRRRFTSPPSPAAA